MPGIGLVMNQKITLSVLGLTLAIIATLVIAPIANKMAYASADGGRGSNGAAGSSSAGAGGAGGKGDNAVTTRGGTTGGLGGKGGGTDNNQEGQGADDTFSRLARQLGEQNSH